MSEWKRWTKYWHTSSLSKCMHGRNHLPRPFKVSLHSVEILTHIKLIKMYPWQKPFAKIQGKCSFSENTGIHMWFDLGKSVWSQTCDIFSFLFDCCAHLERYILLKTPPELDHWFQSYEQLKLSQNNRKQKKIIPFSGFISQSMLPTSDWFH